MMFLNIIQGLASKAIPEELVANSIKDYHVKNFDYICLFRSPQFTVKLYFFDDIISSMTEVVNPHDHRYAFTTYVVRGAFTDMTFAENSSGEVFQKFDYSTPLLGGNGFTWKSETRLAITRQDSLSAGCTFRHDARDFHTIRIDEPNTVLCLFQFEDVVPDHIPTSTFMKDKEPPPLSGLYNTFKYDEIKKRLESIGLK